MSFIKIFIGWLRSMRIKKFTVANYRSILGAKNITMGNYTVLVGKNNEGKSNLIRALNLAIGNMKQIASRNIHPSKNGWNMARYFTSNTVYSYDVDFPKSNQNRRNAVTKIQLHFELSDTDISNFYQSLKLRTNDSLTLVFTYDDNDMLNIQVAKKGGKHWQDQILDIIKFISQGVNFTYIPAVRTSNTFQSIIDSELRLAIDKTIENEEYQNLIDRLFQIEQSAVDDIAKLMTPKLSEWLPTVSGVRIAINKMVSPRYFSYRNPDLYITSSGTETLLENKGDGVQSLFALALLAKNNETSQDGIFAIDEPESHLHPAAVHRLKKTILDLSHDSQVIVATHNPIFVNKNDESSNVIVDGGSVRKAKSIKEVREILGIEVEDNLINTKSVLVVEGLTDRTFIRTFINRWGSQSLKNKIESGQLKIIVSHGVQKMAAKIQILQQDMMKYFVLVDNDEPSVKVIEKLIERQELMGNQYAYIPKKKYQKEVELENLYSDEFISDISYKELNINILSKLERVNRQKKWSIKMEEILPEVGKNFDQQTEDNIKTKLADAISSATEPEKHLSDDGQEFVRTLVEQIDQFFK